MPEAGPESALPEAAAIVRLLLRMETMATQNVVPASVNTLNLTLDQVRERVLMSVEKGHADSYQIGLLYNYVVDSNLAPTGGFVDAPDFFRQRVVVLSQPMLSMYGAIARKFSQAVTVKHGMSKLYTLLTYAKRARVEVDGNEPGPTPITVPQADGTRVNKPFAACSMEELRQAVKHQRDEASPITSVDTARIQSLQERLDRHLPQKHGIRVEARQKGGELRVSLRNVPAAQVERLVAVLVGLPAPDLTAVSQPAAAQVTPQQPVEGVRPALQVVAPMPQAVTQPPVQVETPPAPPEGAMPALQLAAPPRSAMPGTPPHGKPGLFGMLRQALQPQPLKGP
jgi:hypothetical protein